MALGFWRRGRARACAGERAGRGAAARRLAGASSRRSARHLSNRVSRTAKVSRGKWVSKLESPEIHFRGHKFNAVFPTVGPLVALPHDNRGIAGIGNGFL